MIFACGSLAVPIEIMQHVVKVESSGNPFAIGVVGGRLSRQPKNLQEAVAAAKMLEQKGFNFSVGIAQVNRHNLAKYGLSSYEEAFQVCPNLKVGAKILRECVNRSKDWGKAFSCYYSGNFVTGYRHGYVQKIFASMKRGNTLKPYPIIPNKPAITAHAIRVIGKRRSQSAPRLNTQTMLPLPTPVQRTIAATVDETRPTTTKNVSHQLPPPVPSTRMIAADTTDAGEIRHEKTDNAFVF